MDSNSNVQTPADTLASPIKKTTYWRDMKYENNKGSVWSYFLKSSDKKHGLCNLISKNGGLCRAEIKSEGGSTTGMAQHLLRMHDVNIKDFKQEKGLSLDS